MTRREPADVASLLSAVNRYAGARVWVVGDLMLDEYVGGAVERISPEAPVPVVRVDHTELRLGGAANVARQLAALGARTRLAGTLGSDATGDELLRLCRDAGIDTRAVVRPADRRTTRKLRVLGQNQQLLRLDWEDAQTSSLAVTTEILARLDDGERPDVIVLSDYAKGVLTDATLDAMMQLRERWAVPVLVDPKHRDFARYRGASIITPNLRELETAIGRKITADDGAAIVAAARSLIAAVELEAMVVTLGERGMLVVPAAGEEVLIPASRRAVYDVTGAGDTAIAVLAISLAVETPLIGAARIANAAAGVSVGQVGAVAVDAESIRGALAELPASKVMRREELAARATSWRLAGKRIVFTNGCFDLLHSGHLSLLHKAAELGDVLVLAINSDASVRRLKGSHRPVVSQTERAALLAALSCVDAVTIFDEDTPIETLQQLRPHVLVKGEDYTLAQVVGRELIESYGGRVALVPLLAEKSTSALIERIRGIASA